MISLPRPLYSNRMDHVLSSMPWANIVKSEELVYELTLLYTKTKGQPPCCPETLKEFHDEIRNQVKMFNMTTPKYNSKEFRLKDDKLIYVQSWHKHVSTTGITDDESERLIREQPSMVKNFEKVPQSLLDELEIDMSGNKVEDVTDTTNNEPAPEANTEQSTEQASEPNKRKRNRK